MSSSYHPQTDSASKRTNKTVNQLLHYHVNRNQTGWADTLPMVHFNIMNTVNASTGFLPFELHMGKSARIIPLLVPKSDADTSPKELQAWEVIQKLEVISLEVQNNLLLAKISQAAQANESHTLTFPFIVGSWVHLLTLHKHSEYKHSSDGHVAKFMPCYDGPYTIVKVDEELSTVTLDS